MRRAICFVAVTCFLLVGAGVAQADMFVSVGASVQNYKAVTPINGLADTALVIVQVGMSLNDFVCGSVVLQNLNSGSWLTGVEIDYTLMRYTESRFSPYGGIAASAALGSLSDNGFVVSVIAGGKFHMGPRFRFYVEARSLTWINGFEKSSIGVGTGVSLSF